jgi:UrcA family protein
MFHRSKITAGVAAMALAVSAAATLPAAAAAPDTSADIVVRNVGTAGLDLAKQADQARLRHRIAVAASKVCQEVTQGSDLASPAYTDCFLRAASDAWTELDTRVAAARSKSLVASSAAQH